MTEIVLDPVAVSAVVVEPSVSSSVQVLTPGVGVFEINESTRVAVVDGVLYIDEEPP